MSKRNPFDDPEWKRFEDRIRKRMIPEMESSATTLMIAPDASNPSFDVQFAVQIGACVLLEKPLLVLAIAGRPMPPKLERIADRIIYVESTDDPSIKDQIAQFMRDFGKQ
jgi:hypothetical protein